jgi:uncharacterized membrane protein
MAALAAASAAAAAAFAAESAADASLIAWSAVDCALLAAVCAAAAAAATDTEITQLLLPQMLASLGAVFLTADVGDVVGRLVSEMVPMSSAILAVMAYCVGMALFTIIMGNAFAAFPVMTAAIGLPILIGEFDGNVAIVCAIGMLAGFCGTLTTPMAANFNVVPAALLDLPDTYERGSYWAGVKEGYKVESELWTSQQKLRDALPMETPEDDGYLASLEDDDDALPF